MVLLQIIDNSTPSSSNIPLGTQLIASQQKYDSLVTGETLALGVDNRRVSDAHAILYEHNDELFGRDLNRRDGITVNKTRTNNENASILGDKLGIETSKLLLHSFTPGNLLRNYE